VSGTYALHKCRARKCLAKSTTVRLARPLYRAIDLLRVKEHTMMDVIMLAIAAGLFAVSVAYTVACDRL